MLAWGLWLCLGAAWAQGGVVRPQDTMAQRMQACTFCHGEQGRAGPDGYYPRLAGKPEGYLFHQLQNFQQGRRVYRPMNHLLAHMDQAYLREIAVFFADQKVPYPAPVSAPLAPQVAERALKLVRHGDAERKIPACVSCHGAALMGTVPATPGLLGLPRDYLNAQLGAWRNGVRKAHAPDCMADIARRLDLDEIAVVSAWLSSQPVPQLAALPLAPADVPMECGSMGR